jgi:hypothetical protein
VKPSKEWRTINRLRSKYEQRYNRLFKTVLNKQVNEILRDLDNPQDQIERLPYLISTKPIEDAYKKLYRDVGGRFYTLTSQRIKKSEEDRWGTYAASLFGAGINDPVIIETPLAHRIRSIQQTSVQRASRLMEKIITQGMGEGLGVVDIAERIEKEVPKRWRIDSTFRARRIAQTEVIASSNLASITAARDDAAALGVEIVKEWHAGGKNVRDAHIDADARYRGKPIPVDQPFIVGGEAMDRPGDLSASPENVINCKCAIIERVAK